MRLDSQWLDLETVQRRDAKMAPLPCLSIRPSTVRSFYAGARRPCLMQSLHSCLMSRLTVVQWRSTRLPH